MNAYVRFYIYAAVLGFAVFAAFCSGKADTAFRILRILLATTLAAEITAHLLAVRYGHNLIVYHIFVPVQLILIGWYYHLSNPVLRKYRVGWVVTVLSITAAVLNTLFLQPIDSFNSNVMLFTGFCVIGLALSTFYYFYLGDISDPLTGNPHFLVSLIFLFYWSCTFISYAFHEVLDIIAFHKVYFFIWLVNLVSYLSFGLIFLTVKKKWKDA